MASKVKKGTGYYGYILYINKERESKSKTFNETPIDEIMSFLGQLYSEEALIINFNITMNK